MSRTHTSNPRVAFQQLSPSMKGIDRDGIGVSSTELPSWSFRRTTRRRGLASWFMQHPDTTASWDSPPSGRTARTRYQRTQTHLPHPIERAPRCVKAASFTGKSDGEGVFGIEWRRRWRLDVTLTAVVTISDIIFGTDVFYFLNYE